MDQYLFRLHGKEFADLMLYSPRKALIQNLPIWAFIRVWVIIFIERTKSCWSVEVSKLSYPGATRSVKLLLERLRCRRFSDFSLAETETIFASNWSWWGTPFATNCKIVLPETEPFAIFPGSKLLLWRNFLEVEETSCSAWWVDGLQLEALNFFDHSGIGRSMVGCWL